jgi:hypothetical protein
MGTGRADEKQERLPTWWYADRHRDAIGLGSRCGLVAVAAANMITGASVLSLVAPRTG